VRYRKSLITSFLALSAISGAFFASRPPLSVERTGRGVIVHAERLGEYNSYLTDFAIYDEATEAVILRLVPKDGFIEMWSLPLRVGVNQIAPDPTQKDPGFVVAVPLKGTPVVLLKDHPYMVTITGYSMLDIWPVPIRRTARFSLQGS
jgi:hypothetical protein